MKKVLLLTGILALGALSFACDNAAETNKANTNTANSGNRINEFRIQMNIKFNDADDNRQYNEFKRQRQQ